MTGSVQGKVANSIFANGGETGELMSLLDWSQTPVGSVQSWTQSLKSLVKTLLTSRYPMVLTWGAEFTQFYNDAYSQLIGDKHPAALGTDIRETLAEAWDTLGPMIQRVMATGVANWTPALPLILERAGYREESYFSVSHAPAEDDDGQIVGMLGVCSEVTQQVLGERRLQLLRDLAAQTGETRSVQDTCQDLMTEIADHPLDVPFALLYLREEDGKTLTLQGTVGLTVDNQICPHSVDSATNHPLWSFASATDGETVLVEALDHHMIVPGGPWNEPVHTALMMSIASSGQNAPLGVLVAGVNPNRALDESYRSFYELLVGQVSVSIRNAQAYEEERRRAEMLAELDRAKTAFFSNISHEFRTPLTLMLNPLEEVLQSDRLPKAEREQIAIAQRNAQRLLKLVNTLLDFSRIEAGRAQAYFEPTDLATYTVELTSLFQSAVEQAGLRLIVDCPPLPQPVAVDRDMWEKIVLNLLSNAFKFTFEGEITVSLHPVGNQVELTVRDTGTGIPEDDLPRLFERFHRVEGAQGRTFEGTGIGLSLVQELVHLHNGTITVESTLGQGSTFRIQLPMNSSPVSIQGIRAAPILENRYPDNLPQPTNTATSYVQEASSWLLRNDSVDGHSSPASLSPSFSSSARIFLVDDNADMRNYLHRILSEFYQIEVFTEGSAALNAARASTPDLVLSDVMMPGMDGFELLRQLRRDPQTREIPILLLSARAGEEAAVEGLNAGADDYLIKPFSARELLARVAVNVELGRSRQTSARRRLDQVLSSVSDFIYTFDLAGRFTYANQSLLDLWQKPLAEIVGKNFFDLNYPPELAERLQQQIQQVMTTRQPLKDETPYTSALGTRAYEYIFVPLFNTEGAVEAVAGTGRDISDRKQAEQERERFLSVGSDLQVITGNDGYFRWVSPTFERLLGWTAAEMTSRPWTEFVYPEDIPASELETASLFSGSATFEFENRYRHQDGSYRWLLWNAQSYPEEQVIYGAAVDITERKQAEIALRASEERFRTLTATIPQLIWTATPDGSVDYLSQQWIDYVGLPPEQLYDWQWQDVVHPEDLQNTLRDWRHSLEVGEPVEIKHRFRFRTGEWRWQLVRGTPIKNKAGQITKWVGTCTDIQSEIDAQAALHQSEARLRTVAANLPNGAVFIVDRELRYRLAEGKALEEAGMASQDLVGKTIWEALDPSLAAIYEPYFHQTLNGEPFSREHYSHDRHYISHGVPLYDGCHEVEAVLVVSYDITERKQAEIALQESETRYRLLSEAIPQLVWMADANGQNEYVNQRFCDYTGLSAEQMHGSNWLSILHPDDLAMTHDRWLTAVNSGQSYEVEYRFRGADGNYRWFLGQGIPLKDEQGRIYKWFGTCTDIEPQKQVEQAHLRLLEQEQTAREQAETANRIKDEFLAVLSHELRSPLNPILGWTRLLRSGNLDATKTNQAIETIERNAKLQVQLIEDLLDLSRVLRGKLSLSVTPVNLEQVILAALETVYLAAEAKSLRMQTSFVPLNGSVNGDAGRLQQIVWNLLSNAVKFTPQGGQITITLTQVGTSAQIQVIDTGKGIPADFLPYVFEHFRQEDSTTTRKFGGLGLGLAIARHIVELHGGTIQAESPGEGQGATFTVKLPLLQTSSPIQHKPLTTPPPLDLPLAQIRVLVIDDEADTRDLTAFVLEQAGASVTVAPSALIALEHLRQFEFDAVVSDIGMPEMDGYTLMRQLRQGAQSSSIPAIALTAYAGEKDQQQVLQTGFQQHLAKPVEPEALVQAVANLCGRLQRRMNQGQR